MTGCVAIFNLSVVTKTHTGNRQTIPRANIKVDKNKLGDLKHEKRKNTE